ncbi:MAG TPA: P-loop NTPase [Acidimicrobiia bacterium]|jgi:pilus assembly protein CpaE
MTHEGPSTIANPRAARYVVAAVDRDHRIRTKLAIELAGVGAVPYESVNAALEALPADQPSVVVFGPSEGDEASLAAVERLSRTHPTCGVILLVNELSMDILQRALRSGVRDVAAIDAGEAALRQTVERVGDVVGSLTAHGPQSSSSTGKRGRVIVAFSTKGGVGKSMVATNLSTGLAMRGRPTVVVDCDLQFGDDAVLLGIPPQHTTVDAAGAIEHADLAMMADLLAIHQPTQLRVLPAPIEPSAADTITPEAMLKIVGMLQEMHEFVVIDMPPHFDDLVLALIEHADDVLLVASMDIPSIKNLKVGLQTLNLLSLAGDKLKLVLNRANARVNLEISDVERAVGLPVFFRVPSDIAVPQAVNRGTPVVLDRPKSQAAIALAEIADYYVRQADADADATDAPDTPRRRWRP